MEIRKFAHPRPHFTDQCPVKDFPARQGGQDGNVPGGIQQAEQPVKRTLHRLIHGRHAQAAYQFRAMPVRVQGWCLVAQLQHQFRDFLGVDFQLCRQVGLLWRGVDNPRQHRQMDRTGQIGHWLVDDFPVTQLNRLGALNHEAQRRFIDT